MQAAGFLGTAASRSADITLLIEIGMGIGLLAGALLARVGRFRLHAACQSIIVLLNGGLIVLTMFSSFHSQVIPRFPNKITKFYYAIALAHGTLGGVAELGGLYILLAAGTKWLPEKFRITSYRTWMRGVLVLWWLVLALGVATYARWYVPMR